MYFIEISLIHEVKKKNITKTNETNEEIPICIFIRRRDKGNNNSLKHKVDIKHERRKLEETCNNKTDKT